MYYATFKNIGKSDIIVFKTKKERDLWVNFKDQLSKSLGVSIENCTFERKIIPARIAEKRIKKMLHNICEFTGEEWYCVF